MGGCTPDPEATLTIDAAALRASLARLTELAPSEPRPEALFDRVVGTVHTVFGYTGAGLMMLDADQVLRPVASTEGGGLLEQVEEELGRGPCVDSVAYDRVVPVEDVRTDERYSALAERLGEGDGVPRAVLGVPVRLGGSAVAALDVFLDSPHSWDDSESRALEAYSSTLETLLAAALAAHRSDQVAQQLQFALDYRVVIERAVGYVMAAEGVDAVEAFNRLRSAARRNRQKVARLAEDVLAGEPIP